jgi:hypothetical protein
MSDPTSGRRLNIVSDSTSRNGLGMVNDPASWSGLGMVDGAVGEARVARVANEEG